MTAIVPNPTHPALDRQPQVWGNGLARCQGEGDDQVDDAWVQRWGLIDAHYYRHPNQATVATCTKNQSSVPIDGMWTSPSIDILAAGYSGFGEYSIGNADHRLLWIDVSTTSCFGIDPPRPSYRQPRRLTLQARLTQNMLPKHPPQGKTLDKQTWVLS